MKESILSLKSIDLTKIDFKMSDKKQTAFRLSDDLIKRLKAEAKKQNRSLNNLIEVLIDKHTPKA